MHDWQKDIDDFKKIYLEDTAKFGLTELVIPIDHLAELRGAKYALESLVSHLAVYHDSDTPYCHCNSFH